MSYLEYTVHTLSFMSAMARLLGRAMLQARRLTPPDVGSGAVVHCYVLTRVGACAINTLPGSNKHTLSLCAHYCQISN